MNRSWRLPSAVLFTASDPGSAGGHKNVGTILWMDDRGDGRPDWVTVDGHGKVYQAEGPTQAAAAIEVVKANGQRYTHRAVITSLGIDPKPFLEQGVTSCMVECYAQAGDHPYGNLPLMRWQAKHEGWPFIIPVVGVYDDINLQHYLDLNGGAQNFKGAHWKGGPLGIYLAEGMGDTDSWETLALL